MCLTPKLGGFGLRQVEAHADGAFNARRFEVFSAWGSRLGWSSSPSPGPSQQEAIEVVLEALKPETARQPDRRAAAVIPDSTRPREAVTSETARPRDISEALSTARPRGNSE